MPENKKKEAKEKRKRRGKNRAFITTTIAEKHLQGPTSQKHREREMFFACLLKDVRKRTNGLPREQHLQGDAEMQFRFHL